MPRPSRAETAMLPVDPHTFDLAGLIRPGDRILCEQGAAEPRTLAELLVSQADRLERCEVFLGVTLSSTFDPERCRKLRFLSYGGAGRNVALRRAGLLDVLPQHYGAMSRAFAEGRLRAGNSAVP